MGFFSRQTIALTIFGLVVIGSGLFRYLSTTGGENGLYFGLVMGGLVLLGALLLGVGQRLAGSLVGAVAIALVLMWFSYDMYRDVVATQTVGSAEIRKSIVLVVGVAAAIVLFLPSKQAVSPQR